MAHISSTASINSQQLAKTLGQVLGRELNCCLKSIEVREPAAGVKFWQTANAEPGVYIVMSGKVRLLDSTDNLLVTLNAGESFGESTLFPIDAFQPYSARASINLKLGYLPEPILQEQIRQYPKIREHLYHQAVLRDWLLLSPQIATLRKEPGLTKALSLLERHELPVGQLSNIFGDLALGEALRDRKLWLVRQGQLKHTSGKEVNKGDIYAPLQKEGSWQVTQPTALYTLNDSQWKKALIYLPQLARLISADSVNENKVTVEPNKTPNASSSIVETDKHNILPPEKTIPDRTKGRKISQAYFPNPTLQVGHLWQRITRRYPFFQQQSAADCGAACLVMVGRYWGRRFSINRLREIANVERNGASLRSLATAAESIGFTTRPVKASLDKLAEQNLPAIVHWEGKHYIVVYEVKRDRVIVADPAISQLSLTHAQFKAGWTGYTLLLQPTALFKEVEETSTSLWKFFELAKPHRLVLSKRTNNRAIGCF